MTVWCTGLVKTHTWKRIVCQFGNLQRLYWDARSTEHNLNVVTYLPHWQERGVHGGKEKELSFNMLLLKQLYNTTVPIIQLWYIIWKYIFVTKQFIIRVLSIHLWYPRSRVQTRPKPLDFSGEKIPQHAFLRRGSKAVCPMSQICCMLKTSGIYVEIRFPGEICRPFLAHFRSLLPEGSHVAWHRVPLGLTGGTKSGAHRAC
jgi:hypothetical protein